MKSRRWRCFVLWICVDDRDSQGGIDPFTHLSGACRRCLLRGEQVFDPF
jgi:hypothetical protein